MGFRPENSVLLFLKHHNFKVNEHGIHNDAHLQQKVVENIKIKNLFSFIFFYSEFVQIDAYILMIYINHKCMFSDIISGGQSD